MQLVFQRTPAIQSDKGISAIGYVECPGANTGFLSCVMSGLIHSHAKGYMRAKRLKSYTWSRPSKADISTFVTKCGALVLTGIQFPLSNCFARRKPDDRDKNRMILKFKESCEAKGEMP